MMENKSNRDGRNLTRGLNWMQTIRGILQYWSERMDYLRMHAEKHVIVHNIDQNKICIAVVSVGYWRFGIIDRDKKIKSATSKETGKQTMKETT